jgi:hypothetical protein
MDHELRASQKQDVANVIIQYGLKPSAFEWSVVRVGADGDSGVPKLSHKDHPRLAFVFSAHTISGPPNYYYIMYPGPNYRSSSGNPVVGWDAMLSMVGEWLGLVTTELDAADPWTVVAAEPELGTPPRHDRER